MSETQDWERKTLEKVALAGIQEQKRSRRWRIFFMVLFFIYLTFIAVSISKKANSNPNYDVMGQKISTTGHEHIALIHLSDVIAANKEANAQQLSEKLNRAAGKSDVKGIMIVANSPGGSPVQSSLVYQSIKQIKEKYHKPVVTVITDVCASGCYYIVSASDEIYADKSSIVGSIGVISQSFGYQETAKKLGISPRTYTAGKNKDFMNPAREPREAEIQFLKQLLDELHQHFITAVKTARKTKLADDPDLFTGLFWTGEKALALGLIDGIATPQMVAKKMGGYPVYDYSAKQGVDKLLEKLGINAKSILSDSFKQTLNLPTAIEFK